MTVAIFLILFGGNGTLVVVPKPFTSVEACEKSGKAWEATSAVREYVCLPHEDGYRFPSK